MVMLRASNTRIVSSQDTEENFSSYREFYKRRVQRLERFKKARSYSCVASCYDDNNKNNNNETDNNEQISTVENNSEGGGNLSLVAKNLCNDDIPCLIDPKKSAEQKERDCAEENQTTTTNPESESSNGNEMDGKFVELREKMISLMENDVTLIRQLLALGETIEDLKAERKQKSHCVSEGICFDQQDSENYYNYDSLTSDDDCFYDEDNYDDRGEKIDEKYSSIKNLVLNEKSGPIDGAARINPGVTKINIDHQNAKFYNNKINNNNNIKNDQNKIAQSPLLPTKRYFSRKNSVLRIPIPPQKKKWHLMTSSMLTSSPTAASYWRAAMTSPLLLQQPNGGHKGGGQEEILNSNGLVQEREVKKEAGNKKNNTNNNNIEKTDNNLLLLSWEQKSPVIEMGERLVDDSRQVETVVVEKKQEKKDDDEDEDSISNGADSGVHVGGVSPRQSTIHEDDHLMEQQQSVFV